MYFCPKQGQDFKPPAAPLYPNMGQVPPPPGPIWRFHTGLSKFLRNISTNIWSLGRRTGLKLGEVPYFLSSVTSQFRSFFHWIVFNLFFLLRDSENDLYRHLGLRWEISFVGIYWMALLLTQSLRKFLFSCCSLLPVISQNMIAKYLSPGTYLVIFMLSTVSVVVNGFS